MIHINSDEEYKALESTKERRIAKLGAQWCGPCLRIAPYFEELSGVYKNTEFVSLDVDECPETATHLSARSLPTFVILDKEGKEITRLAGAHRDKLSAMLKSHCK